MGFMTVRAEVAVIARRGHHRGRALEKDVADVVGVDNDGVAIHLEEHGPEVGLCIAGAVSLVMTMDAVELEFDVEV